MSGSNIVPMPKPAMPMPAAPPMPYPGMWGGGAPLPGCCPPGGMDQLMQCYCDIQKTLAFMSQIMQTLLTNDPAVQAAMIAGIEKSGSNVPLIGVTNGSIAQPGQVGEFIGVQFSTPFTSGSSQTTVTATVLQPGDWQIWVIASPTTAVEGLSFFLSPQPAGLLAAVAGFFILTGGTATAIDLMSTLGGGSFSVPTLMAFQVNVSATAAGTMDFALFARRMR